MPRLKPTTKIDVIGNLDLSPEAAVGDFIESKQQEAYFIKPPNWDSAGDSIELLYIRNSREHAGMMRLQKEMLENAKRQAASNRSRIRKLYKVHGNLRKRFIEVNSFIKDCVDKKSVAEKKVADETDLHAQLRDDIDKCKANIEELSEFRDVLQETVKGFEPYEAVLEEVVQKSDIFESVKDCMDRCDALMLAQVEISRLEQEKIQEIEEMRKRMVKVTNEAALTVLGLKNDLAELERSYNQARSECSKWEKIMAGAKETVANHDLNKDRSLDGIHYMYRLLCKRRNFEGRSDGESMLKILSQLRPRRVIVVHGTEEGTQTVAKHCEQNIGARVFTPRKGETVDATTETYIYQVRLTEGLLTQLQFQKGKDAEVAWVNARIGLRTQAIEGSAAQNSNADNDVSETTEEKTFHNSVLINELKLSDFKQVLMRNNINSDSSGGVLWCCNGSLALRRIDTGKVTMEGCLSEEYYKIRELLYEQYATV